MNTWLPVFMMPNMCINEPFENEYLAIVSPEDDRCIEINRRHPTFLPFLDRFTDPFRRKVIPSVLLMRGDAPGWVKSWEAVGGFRDILSISTVVYNRTAVLTHSLPRNYQYSTSFDFYAWMLSKDYLKLLATNPALHGFELADEFHGQTTAGLPTSNFDRLDFDEFILKALLAEWTTRFSKPTPSWRSLALFRSLNMAHAAAQIPGVVEVTNSSLGRNVGLWVSAFEILAHPGNEDTGVKRVYDLLDQVDWRTQDCQEKIHGCYEGRTRKGRGPRRNVACWIYGEINHARIDYLHGNPIGDDRLIVKATGKNLFTYVPSLYRMLLVGFLGRNFYGPFKPREPDVSAYDPIGVLSFRFNSKQGDYEHALADILKPKQFAAR
jgi:hypothetical protein